jgi:hypothetical protein
MRPAGVVPGARSGTVHNVSVIAVVEIGTRVTALVATVVCATKVGTLVIASELRGVAVVDCIIGTQATTLNSQLLNPNQNHFGACHVRINVIISQAVWICIF